MTHKPASIVCLASLFVLALFVNPAFAEEERVKVVVKKVHVECEDGDDSCDDHVFVHHGDGAHAIAIGGGHGHGGYGKGGHLGVQLTELTSELKEHFGLPDSSGVMVAKVVEDSPALAAGLVAGDIITAVDGEAVDDPAELSHAIRSRESGETVVLEAWRDGRMQQISATLAESESPVRIAHRRVIECKDGDDCDIDVEILGDHLKHLGHLKHLEHLGDFDFDFDFDCGDEENCNMTIVCDDGDCECTQDGEAVDCDALGD